MKIRKGSWSYAILTALEKAAAEGVFETFSYSAQMNYLRSLSNLSEVKESYLSKSIKRFKERGLLEYEKNKEGETAVKLTNLGRDALGIEDKWDGKYRVVIWDIPEKKRRLRDLLRRKLKEWKFVAIQKSVWVSKRSVTKQLRDLILELEMEKWVAVIESTDPVFSDIKFHDRG